MNEDDDVPSPVDLSDPADARAWEATAMAKRPERLAFFERFLGELRGATRILELGSGPGFLAKHLLSGLPEVRQYVALDVSAAMHALAAVRLGALAERVRFVERNFRESGFAEDLGPFDAVVSLQSLHELRHKRHAASLHGEVRAALAPSGMYMPCDHVCGPSAMTNDRLYMTVDEQQRALQCAGFADVSLLLQRGSLALWQAR